MQQRRPKQALPQTTLKGEIIQVPPEYWDEIQKRNVEQICQNSLAAPQTPEGLRIRFLSDNLLIDIQNCRIYRTTNDSRNKIDYPLMELVLLVYLLNVTSVPLAQDMISVNDLKDAHFFQGPHTLKTAPVLERFGNDLNGFKRAAESLDGEPLDLADAAYKLSPLPKTPLYYLLWEGDEEFQSHLSILFDRSIEHHLSADAIWGLVILVSNALLLNS